jgi:beta-galactosidase
LLIHSVTLYFVIDVKNGFNALRQYMPKGPLMNSEYYPGWLTHWGEQLQQTPTAAVLSTLKEMLDRKVNINFYVFFGGTNFEYTAGKY